MIISLIGVGFATGVASGLFGIGGGTVLIPLLITLFSQFGVTPALDMHIAIATSLALIIPMSTASSVSHYRNHTLDLNFSKSWIPGICFGALIGVFFINYTSSFWLKVFFSIYLLFCIIYSVFEKAPNDDCTGNPPIKFLVPFSVIVGCCSTMLGIGGGTFTTPILTFFNYPIKKALAISSFTGLFIGIIGTIIIALSSISIKGLPPFSLGFVNWFVFLLVMPTAIIGSIIGVKCENKLSNKTLERAYIIFLCIVFSLMIYHVCISSDLRFSN
jgi:uncharacterized membrane protein YfcA